MSLQPSFTINSRSLLGFFLILTKVWDFLTSEYVWQNYGILVREIILHISFVNIEKLQIILMLQIWHSCLVIDSRCEHAE